MTEQTEKEFNFTLNTLVFCILGIVISGFTSVGLFGLQQMFVQLGAECSNAWKMLWILGWVGSFVLPYFFIKSIKSVDERKLSMLKSHLIFFNLFQLLFLQAAFSSLLTNGKTLCYVSDGQNGLELVFAAWLALPLLFAFSFYFSKISLFKK